MTSGVLTGDFDLGWTRSYPTTTIAMPLLFGVTSRVIVYRRALDVPRSSFAERIKFKSEAERRAYERLRAARASRPAQLGERIAAPMPRARERLASPMLRASSSFVHRQRCRTRRENRRAMHARRKAT